MASLETLQRCMQTVITAPGGVQEGLAELKRHAGVEASFIRASPTLAAPERLAIYWRSYHLRLVQALQALFPTVRYATGDALFDRFGLAYLSQHPPTSFTLDRLADCFAGYLQATRPENEAEEWPDFLIDLVKLEWTVHQVYHGSGWEQRRPILPRVWMTLDDASLLATIPELSPALRVLTLRYPVHTYMQAVRRDERPGMPPPAEHHLAVSRQAYRVAMDSISEATARLLAACDDQKNVRALCEVASVSMTCSELRDGLVDWTARQWVRPALS